MAWSSAELSATDLALMAADKPILLGRQWLRESGISTRWNQGGSWAGADETDADGSLSYGYDDYDHLQTFPDSSQTTWYFLIDLGATAPGILDAFALLYPANLNGVQIDLQVADDNAYTTNLQTIHTVTPSDNYRVIGIDLDHTAANPRRYSSVRYLRFKFTKGSGFIPRFGECVLSRRRQLKHKSMMPWDPYNLQSSTSRFESMSGIISEYSHYKNRRKAALSFRPHEDAYISDLETFFETDIDGGTKPFLWIENPNSAPGVGIWMKLENPELAAPLSGVSKRNFSIIAKEQGPNFYSLGV